MAVCNRGEKGLVKAQSELGDEILLFSDYRELIDSGKVDAVIISTPHFSHVEIASYALGKNLHVLLEKPAGASSYNVLM